ncbi:MAG: SDR family NAD(P)-dependent oxidoreductase [Actinomycetota bacterium]
MTGAARGVGRATVHAFLAAGWRVVAGVRDVATARDGLGPHPGLTVVALDVTDDGEVRDGVARAEDVAGGALGAVVLNAGFAVMGAQDEADLDEVRAMFETNVFGAARVVQAALPAMRDAGGGAAVFVSSIAARLPIPLLGYYQASKAAMGLLAESLSIETRPYGVRVALVEPGMIATEFGRSTRRTGAAAHGEGAYAELLPAVRGALGMLRERYAIGPEEVARVVVQAATDPAAPFRTVLGGDARIVDDLRARAPYPAYQDALLAFLGIDWPRGGDGRELDVRGVAD